MKKINILIILMLITSISLIYIGLTQNSDQNSDQNTNSVKNNQGNKKVEIIEYYNTSTIEVNNYTHYLKYPIINGEQS